MLRNTLSLAQAKTGTGKTLAFLIPCIERLLRSNPQPSPGQISVLIMSVRITTEVTTGWTLTTPP